MSIAYTVLIGPVSIEIVLRRCGAFLVCVCFFCLNYSKKKMFDNTTADNNKNYLRILLLSRVLYVYDFFLFGSQGAGTERRACCQICGRRDFVGKGRVYHSVHGVLHEHVPEVRNTAQQRKLNVLLDSGNIITDFRSFLIRRILPVNISDSIKNIFYVKVMLPSQESQENLPNMAIINRTPAAN